MKKLNSLLNKVALFEKLAQYGDRKSFLESMAQDTRSTWDPEPFYPNLGGRIETGPEPEPDTRGIVPYRYPDLTQPSNLVVVPYKDSTDPEKAPSGSKSPEIVKANSLLAECYNALTNGVNGEIFESLVKRLREMVVFLRASVKSPSLKYPAEVKSMLAKVESMYAKMSAEFNKSKPSFKAPAIRPSTIDVPKPMPGTPPTPSSGVGTTRTDYPDTGSVKKDQQKRSTE